MSWRGGLRDGHGRPVRVGVLMREFRTWDGRIIPMSRRCQMVPARVEAIGDNRAPRLRGLIRLENALGWRRPETLEIVGDGL